MVEHAVDGLKFERVHTFHNLSAAMAACLSNSAGPIAPQMLVNGDLNIQAGASTDAGSKCSSVIAPSDSASHVGVPMHVLVAAGGFGERVPDHGHFYCCKCKLQKPLVDLRARGSQKICFVDVNSNSAFVAR